MFALPTNGMSSNKNNDSIATKGSKKGKRCQIEQHEGIWRIARYIVHVCVLHILRICIYEKRAEYAEIPLRLTLCRIKNCFENFIALQNIYEIMSYVCHVKCPRSVNFNSMLLLLVAIFMKLYEILCPRDGTHSFNFNCRVHI